MSTPSSHIGDLQAGSGGQVRQDEWTATDPERGPGAQRLTPPQLLHEIATVVQDLPRFATAPLYRRWHRRWGTTPDEVAAAMPGDDLVSAVHYCATRAI